MWVELGPEDLPGLQAMLSSAFRSISVHEAMNATKEMRWGVMLVPAYELVLFLS
jgi:hypothetical protein